VYVSAATDSGIGGAVLIDKLFDWSGENVQAGLDENAIYNKVLTPAQITTHYGAQMPPPPDLGNVASDPYGNVGSANQGSPLYDNQAKIAQMAGRRPSALQMFEMPLIDLAKRFRRKR
jgi:hypothetical protein